jgi:hypothetical protein
LMRESNTDISSWLQIFFNKPIFVLLLDRLNLSIQNYSMVC